MTELTKITQDELDELFATEIKNAGIRGSIKEQEFLYFHFKNVDVKGLDLGVINEE